MQIVPQRGMSSLVCSSTITVAEMCVLATKLQKEVADSELLPESDDSENDGDSYININNDSFGVAKHLRSQMKKAAQMLATKNDNDEDNQTQKGDNNLILSQPVLHPSTSTASQDSQLEISYESAFGRIPKDIYNHIAWIITKSDAVLGENGRVKLTDNQRKKVLDVAQDLMVHSTSIPMPKHVGLALHILKQTGSKSLVQILNKFGHVTSYDDAQRYITTEAKNISIQSEDEGLFVPAGILRGRFSQYALDNLDFHEHTPTGVTMHATTHNIYQYKDDEDESAATIQLKKTRNRSIEKPPTFTLDASYVSLADRRNARSIENVPLSYESQAHLIQSDYLLWVLMRLESKKEYGDMVLPRTSWNQFYEAMYDATKFPTSVAYGPLFPQSPTDPSVVQASLNYFISLNQKIGQTTTVVTADQAIYDIIKGKF